MLKRLLSLNLAIVMLLSLLPAGIMTARAAEDIGYASFSANYEGGEVKEQAWGNFLASNAALRLYQVMPEFKRDGYAMIGYNSEPDGSGKMYGIGETIRGIFATSEADAPTLYAQWQAVTGDHIVFRAYNGLTADGKDYYVMDGFSGTAVLPEGDVFRVDDGDRKVVGWSVRNNSNTYLPGDEFAVDGSAVLYAQIGVQMIRFSYNSWNGATHEQNLIYYSNNDPLDYNPGNYGSMVFLGWNSKRDGSGEWYSNGTLAVDAPQKLYAQYAEIPEEDYYILHAYNGLANGQEYDVVYTVDNDTLPGVVKAGNVAYWSGAGCYFPTGVIPNVPNGAMVSAVVSNGTDYYTVVDGNGGRTERGSEYTGRSFVEVVTSPGQLNIYSAIGSDLGIFVKDGYALIGYENAVNGKIYGFGDSLKDVLTETADADHITWFNAVYTEVTGDYIQYLGNGAVTADGSAYYLQDGLDLSAENKGAYASCPFVAPKGKKFVGWKDSDGNWYDPGDAIETGETLVLYAQWGGVRVVCDGNTDSYMYGGVKHYILEDYSAEISAPAELNTILFAGWNSKADGTGIYYTAGRKIAIPEDYPVVTVYAQWVKLPESGYYYYLCANALESGKLREAISMDSATATVKLPTAIDGDSTLYGWFTSLQGQGETAFIDEMDCLYAPGGEMTVNSEDRVWAMTDRGYEMIRYHGNGATTASGEETRVNVLLTSYSSLTVYGVADVFDVIPEGKTFSGWNTEPDGSGTAYKAGTWNVSGVDLYAQWSTPESYLLIDGVRYDATQSCSGTGWRYYFNDYGNGNVSRQLYVYNNYSGKRIEIVGDVSISLRDCFVQGEDGKAAITVDGNASIRYSSSYNENEDYTAVLTGGAGASAVEVTGDLEIRVAKYAVDGEKEANIILIGGAGASAITASGHIYYSLYLFAGKDADSLKRVNTYGGEHYVRVSNYSPGFDTCEFDQYLYIDGKWYDASMDQSGTGWTFHGADNCSLNLDENYSGSPIICNRDLNLYGWTTITGTDQYGIYVDGDLTISGISRLEVYGSNGYAAICATGTLTMYPEVTAVGGVTSALSAEEIILKSYSNPIKLTLGSSAEDAVVTEYLEKYADLTGVYDGEIYFSFEILPYELTLMGNGGVTENGEEFRVVVFTDSSSSCLYLYKDSFTNGDKLQVGWTDTEDAAEGKIYAMDDIIEIWDVIRCTLYALWEDDVNKGVVLDNYCGTYWYNLNRKVVPVKVGDVYTLPNIDLPLRKLVGWRGTDGVLYPAGTEITVTETLYFTAEYRDDLYIIIDGVKYDPNNYASGKGWSLHSYDYDFNLNLRNYNGGPILTNTDLRIYIEGENVITGDDGYGIYADGTLQISCNNSNKTSLTVTGAEGYEAIYAEGTLTLPESLTAIGGGKAALHGEEISFSRHWYAYRVFLGESAETAEAVEYVGEKNWFAYDGEEYLRIEKLPYTLTLHGNGGLTADGEDTYVITLTDGMWPEVSWEDVKDIFTNGDETLLGFAENADGSGMLLTPNRWYTLSYYGKLEQTMYAIWGEEGDLPDQPEEPEVPEEPEIPDIPDNPDIPVIPDYPVIPSIPEKPKTEEVVRNEDGSTTTIVVDKKTGTVTETTEYTDGTVMTVVTSADGEQEIEVSVPRGVVAEVTIPAEHVSMGTVAVIIHEDGSEEVIPYSIPGEDGLTVTLSESAELKIVDRAMNFSDVGDTDWFSNAVDFVSARGIMNGTGDDAFSHAGTTTRAMVWTMLARLNGTDTTGGASWYEKGLDWAMENGISDGSNADGAITREQLAVMLWRLVGSPAEEASLDSFTDDNNVSDYAQQAMAWAVANGIINGMGDGTLNPGGNATRAQVAQILMNFMMKI